MQNEHPDDFVSAIERTMMRIRDGEANEAEIEAFRTLLYENREARLAYLRANQLDCMLGMVDSGFEANTLEQIGGRPIRGIRIPMVIAGMAVAAAVVLLMAMWPGNQKQELGITEPPIATLTSAPDSVINGRAPNGTDIIEPGVYSFGKGVAEITFAKGAQVVPEGPCSFEIIDAMTMSLNHGKLWAYCPEQAHGFEVLSPDGRKIIDLGTEFGVEVQETGTMNVHVFEGIIDVVDEESGKKALDAGQAIKWTAGKSPGLAIEADFDKFVTASDLTRKRFRDYRTWMSERDDMLLHYHFAKAQEAVVSNEAAAAMENTAGRIIGADLVGGRSPVMPALQFENAGDSIAFQLDVANSLPGFTIAMWVKVDRLENSYATLLNSEGWEPGDVHFQVGRDGSLRSGINGINSFVCSSGSVRPGQWQLLAVTWDLGSKTPLFSVNGQIVSSRPNPRYEKGSVDSKVLFGESRIGTWDGNKYDQPDRVRDLKARVDEVMIFRRLITEDELTEIYERGRP